MVHDEHVESDEEVVPERENMAADDVELEDVESRSTDTIRNLKEKLKACEKEKSDYLEALQRAKADFLNSKRRNEEQLKRDTDRAANAFIEKLLPLCDSFDGAMGNAEAWDGADEAWKTGIKAIRAQLDSILVSYGVERIGERGEHFDPSRHEALQMKEGTGEPPDTVHEVLQPGYMRGTELLRPAKVILNH